MNLNLTVTFFVVLVLVVCLILFTMNLNLNSDFKNKIHKHSLNLDNIIHQYKTANDLATNYIDFFQTSSIVQAYTYYSLKQKTSSIWFVYSVLKGCCLIIIGIQANGIYKYINKQAQVQNEQHI